MRKRIVTISMDIYPTHDDIAGMRSEFNAMGIDPLFISAGVKVLEPEKKAKRHRLTRKRRCRVDWDIVRSKSRERMLRRLDELNKGSQ